MQPIPLGDEDRAILELEGPTIVGHTAKVIRIDGPRPPLAQLRARIVVGLAREPALSCRIGGPPGAPAWEADPGFEIADHVVDSGRAGLDETELKAFVVGLFTERLDRARPLWRIDIAGLADGGWVLVWRLHHALADGTTTMRFARELLWDAAPEPPTRPSSPGRAGDDSRRRAHLARFVARELTPTVRDSPFDGETGTRRSLALSTLPLGALHDAAKRICGASINDALLTLVAGGARHWLVQQGRHLGSLRIRVPVSLHHDDDQVANRDSFFLVPVSTAEADPVARLRQVQRLETARKADRDADRLRWLSDALSSLSPRLAAHLDNDPRAFAVCVSNVRGPSEPVRVLGAPVRSMHSIVEVGRRHGLRIGALSFSGTLCVGFCADPQIVPDVDRMAAGFEAEAERLIAAG